MHRVMKWVVVIGMTVGVSGARRATAQASYTATQELSLSAFGGLSGNWTNLEGGRNVGITAGVDLALPTYHRYRPVLEVRGTYPIEDGQIDAQKEFVAGLRVERQFYRWHPYVDFLAGRGQMNYQNGGFSYGDFTYLFSTSAVYSGGVGVDVDVTRHFGVRADLQVQHWDTPFPATSAVAVTTSRAVPALGSGLIPEMGARPATVVVAAGTAPQTIYPKMATVGVVYRFDFNHHGRRRP